MSDTTGGSTDRSRAALIVGVTTDDDRYAEARRAAMDIAAETDAPLILYDWDAATVLGAALPTEWSAEGTDAAVPERLDEPALEAAGRAALAEQVGEARRRGIEATGWLPADNGADGLVDYADRQGATVIVVPRDLHAKGGLERLGEGAAPSATVRGRSPARVVVVPAGES